jgi:hypothetical protein
MRAAPLSSGPPAARIRNFSISSRVPVSSHAL